jgi:putative protein kinase ArgK-like GTPase of G3E family
MGEGIAELAAAIASHADALQSSGEWELRRRASARDLLIEAARERLWRRFEADNAAALAGIIEQVRDGSLDPESAAAMLVEERRA